MLKRKRKENIRWRISAENQKLKKTSSGNSRNEKYITQWNGLA